MVCNQLWASVWAKERAEERVAKPVQLLAKELLLPTYHYQSQPALQSDLHLHSVLALPIVQQLAMVLVYLAQYLHFQSQCSTQQPRIFMLSSMEATPLQLLLAAKVPRAQPQCGPRLQSKTARIRTMSWTLSLRALSNSILWLSLSAGTSNRQ